MSFKWLFFNSIVKSQMPEPNNVYGGAFLQK